MGKKIRIQKMFGNLLKSWKAESGLPIVVVDERFSSAAADRMEGSAASRDEKAAMIILQSYLESRK